MTEEACFFRYGKILVEKTATKLPRNLYKLLSCPNSHLKQVLFGQVAQGLDFQNSSWLEILQPFWASVMSDHPQSEKSAFFLLLVVVCCPSVQTASSLHVTGKS